MINSIYIHIYAYTLAYTAVGCHGEEWIQIPASHRPDLVFQFLYCTQVTFCFSAVCDFFVFFSFCSRIKYLGNCRTDLRQIHRKDVLGPSLGRLWMSRSKIKGQGHQRQKTGCALPSPPTATEWIALAANNVTHHSVAAGGDFGGLRTVCVNFGKTSLTLVFSEREL